MPTGGEGNCLHIIRLEDGSIPDLTNIFLDSLAPFGIPAGTVVLLHSLSHLAWVGPATYTEDLVRARQRISGTYRSGILVLHGLPLSASGSTDSNIANDLTAVSDWLNLVRDPSERDISLTRDLWQARLLANGRVPSLTSVRLHPHRFILLPTVCLRHSWKKRLLSLRLQQTIPRFGLRPTRPLTV